MHTSSPFASGTRRPGGSTFNHLRSPDAVPGERRRSVRYPTIPPLQARLGWWECGTEHETPAEVHDVSSQGVLLSVDRVPPQSCELWFRMEGPGPCEWTRIKIARTVWPNRIGGFFPDGCPYELFKEAQGVRAEEQHNAVSEFNSRDWH